jgi:type I restriction enzyme M protein
MAIRPIFIPTLHSPFFEKRDVSFKWHAGFSLSQKQKSLSSLHRNAKELFNTRELLEISSKSPEQLGNKLSAFNLRACVKDKSYDSDRQYSLETLFQTSKVFNNNMHCIDLLRMEELDIRKEIREREKRGLSHFAHDGDIWNLEPKGAFYNFLYIRSLLQIPHLFEALDEFDAFTDIAFNPNKSFNCQAESVSIFVGLNRVGLSPSEACSSQSNFLNLVYGISEVSSNETANFLDHLN